MTGSGGHFPRLNFERGSVAILALARFVFDRSLRSRLCDLHGRWWQRMSSFGNF